jgi:hypothetical protein
MDLELNPNDASSSASSTSPAEPAVPERLEKNGQHKPRRRKLTEKRRMQNRQAQKNYRMYHLPR